MRTAQPIIRLLTFFGMLVLLCGCPPRICDPVTTVYPPIPDSILSFIPYNNGEIYKFEHAKGHVIEFTCDRKVEENNDCYDCDQCFNHEEVITILKPNYSVSPIHLYLYNSWENHYNLQFSFGTSSFDLVANDIDPKPIDSLYIGDVLFQNVYALADRNHNDTYGVQHKLYADSLYYSAEKGIIRITMSNDEYFQRYEE